MTTFCMLLWRYMEMNTPKFNCVCFFKHTQRNKIKLNFLFCCTKALQTIKYKSLMADWCSAGFTFNPRIDLRMHTSFTELRILSLVYLAWKILEKMFMNRIPLYSEKPRKMHYVCSDLFNQKWGFSFFIGVSKLQSKFHIHIYKFN